MTQMPRIPTLDDVRAARERIAPYLSPTRLYRCTDLTDLVGAEIWVKHENHPPLVPSRDSRGGPDRQPALSVQSSVPRAAARPPGSPPGPRRIQAMPTAIAAPAVGPAR
jgi:threonine dehydratase